MMDQKIAAVGDSHSFRCFQGHNRIADSTVFSGINKLDGKTAYKIADHHKRVMKVILPLREKHLLFCFGEVDIRIHIKYQHLRTGLPVDSLLERTAQRYTEYVSDLRTQGFDIHIFNVVPTGDFSGLQFEGWKKKLTYPFLTDFSERQEYTVLLNRQLRRYCSEKNIPFVDIYKYLVDETGKRRRELIYDFSHLNAQTADIVLEHYRFS
jgi:lysophospholipase L1-like esterase